MDPVTPEQLAAIQAAEAKAVAELDKRLGSVPFGELADTAKSAPVDKKVVAALVKAIRKAGAVDAAELVRVLTGLAGQATAAYFTGRIPVPSPAPAADG